MKIKFIAVILTLASLLGCILACAEQKQPGVSSDDEAPGVLDSEYVVVRAETSDKLTTEAAVTLRALINEKASLDIQIKTDYLKKDEKAAEKEIVVGKTNRDVQFDRTTLTQGQYYVGIEGKRVIIDAYDSLTLNLAIPEIVENWFTLGEGTFMLDEKVLSDLSSTKDLSSISIRVMSQNIRYANDGNGNDIKQRAPRFKQLVEMYQPDIIGTQESTATWNAYYQAYFKDVYGMVGCSRDGRNETVSGEWGTILYRLDRFELLDSDDFWLTSTPGKVSRVPGSACNRICTWALLKDKQTGKEFVMANTHLDYTTDEVKLEQYKYLMQGLSGMIEKYPLYLTGDFNATLKSPVYAKASQDLNDPYVKALENRSTVNHTADGYGTSSSDIIDYCFYDDNSIAVWYKILSEQFGGYISDHFGIIAEFIIK